MTLKIETRKYRLRFTSEMLATKPNNKELLNDWLATKAPDQEKVQEELDAVPEKAKNDDSKQTAEQKLMCVFASDEKGIFLFDYQLKGFFKEALSVFSKSQVVVADGDECDERIIKLRSIKKVIDNGLFVSPRRVRIQNYRTGPNKEYDDQAAEGELPKFTRPLRASGPTGERVALACSQLCSADAFLDFSVELVQFASNSKSKDDWSELSFDLVEGMLSYGRLKGLGQWRSGGFGRFTWEVIP